MFPFSDISTYHNSQFCDSVNIYFSCGLSRRWICPVWNPRRLFNGRLALTHHRNQVRRMFYDLVNEQWCCETCVCVLGGWWVGVWCLIGIYLSPPPHHPTPPLCLDGGVLPREQCWTGRNLCPDFQRFSHIPYTRAWMCWDCCPRVVRLSQPQVQAHHCSQHGVMKRLLNIT